MTQETSKTADQQGQHSIPGGRISFPGMILGAVLFGLLMALPAPTGLDPSAWAVVAVATLMAVWWVTEAIPIPATSLLPILLLPLVDATTTRAASTPYASPVIYLLLGGFVAAMGMQQTGLHRRIALFIVARAGQHPASLMGGFMAASALLSMWISNTATTLMLVPIALTVAQTALGPKQKGHPFTIALMIGLAWSASIGGLGTYIGTPPNLFVKAFVEEATGRDLLFIEWMAFAIPIVLVLVPLAWFLLAKLIFRFDPKTLDGAAEVVAAERAKLPPITSAEKRVALIMGTMALLWMTRQLLVEWDGLTSLLPFTARLSDTHIALAGGLAMFLTPQGGGKAGAILSWDQAVTLPWGVILLFGGGLSLAAAIQSTGLSLWLGTSMQGLAEAPLIVTLFAVVLMVIFLTELTSNTATVAALVPVMGALADVADVNALMLAAPVAMAGSCAFMLPVATGPNAVVFASGQITVPQMMKAGFYMNLMGAVVVTGLCYLLLPLIFA